MGPYPPYPPYEPGPKSRLPLIIGIVVAALVLLGGGGGALALGLALSNNQEERNQPGPPTPTLAAPTNSASVTPTPGPTPNATPSGDFLSRLNERETDPEPLTLDELFRDKQLPVEGRTYTRAARKEDKDCAAAVRGSALRDALRKGDCTQLLRASYVSEDGDVVGTIGIANLADADAAKQAYESAQGRNTHVNPLPGSGPAGNLGRDAAALGGPSTSGHYLILRWVQYADGHAPSSTKDKTLVRFSEDVFENTVLTALGFRRLTGQPLTP